MTNRSMMNMSKNTLFKIIKSELFTAQSYIERIIVVFKQYNGLDQCIDCQKALQSFQQNSNQLFADSFIKLMASKDEEVLKSKRLEQCWDDIKLKNNLLGHLFELGLDLEKALPPFASYINSLYQLSYRLHTFLFSQQELQIEYPRVNLIQYNQKDDGIPLFSLPLESLLELIGQNNLNIDDLDKKRQQRYEYHIHLGHEMIFSEHVDMAIDSFSKALLYKESAEATTLLGWAYSKKGDMEMAKKLCVQAMKIDHEYGPAYNDLGSYLLRENKIDESLLWFAKAKKATYYQNREYPYINSGRAYMARSEFKKAMDEFKMAQQMAPFHEQLHDTISKLQGLLNKENSPLPSSPFTP
jgi:Tfp pilus assembly protein PilF